MCMGGCLQSVPPIKLDTARSSSLTTVLLVDITLPVLQKLASAAHPAPTITTYHASRSSLAPSIRWASGLNLSACGACAPLQPFACTCCPRSSSHCPSTRIVSYYGPSMQTASPIAVITSSPASPTHITMVSCPPTC